MTKPILRDYQAKVVDDAKAALMASASARVLIVGPTGCGKSVIIGALVEWAVSEGWPVLILAHRNEIILQISAKLHALGIDHGLIKAGHKPRPGEPIQVAGVQSLHARAIRSQRIEMQRFKLVIIDECHHVRARTYREILEALPDAAIVGLTATPARGDGRGLGNVFNQIIEAPQVPDLIARGYLVPTLVYAPHVPDMSGVQTKAGDYNEGQAAERVDRPELVADVVEQWLKRARGLATIVFACGVGHSKHLCDRFRLAGILAEHIDGATPADERDAILKKLAKGEIDVVCNCGVLTEGFDAPTVGCIVLARPTKSTVLYRQMIGRGLRPAPGKQHCIVLDHSGAVFRHGFVEDSVIWTLSEDKRAEVPAQVARTSHRTPQLVTCPECHAVRLHGAPCSACGWKPRVKAQHVETRDGDLVAVDRNRRTAPAFATAQECDQFHRELLGIARERSYKPGWASHKYREKFGAWPQNRWATPIAPSDATRAWVRSRQIAYAKSQAKAGAA